MNRGAWARYEEHGADPKAGNEAAIIEAAYRGNPPVVEYLAGRIFHRDLWRGHRREEIEAAAGRLLLRFPAPHVPIFREELGKEAAKAVQKQALLTIFALRAEWAEANPIKIVPPGKPKPL